jgi:hypothetical protein
MSYAIKTTGIPAAYTVKSLLVVDSDNTTIVDLERQCADSRRCRHHHRGRLMERQHPRLLLDRRLGLQPAVDHLELAAVDQPEHRLFDLRRDPRHQLLGGGNGIALIGQSSSGDRVNGIPNGGGYGISHSFASTEIYVASSGLSASTKLSVMSKGVRGGAQSTRQGQSRLGDGERRLGHRFAASCRTRGAPTSSAA